MKSRPEPHWIQQRVLVNGSPLQITLDLSWASCMETHRPKHMFDYGHDLDPRFPARLWDGFWAARSCRAVEQLSRSGVGGAMLVGTHLGLGQIGVLVAMWNSGPTREFDEAMRRAWPMRGSAWAMGWAQYDRLLSFVNSG